MLLDTGSGGTWTLGLDRGRVSVHRGGTTRPTLTVRCEPAVLADLVRGTSTGTQAFLDGVLTVRGDLALALQLDGALTDADAVPPEAPRAAVADVLGIRTVWLEAGPPDGPPVVLLHGLGATNASLLPVLVDLARDHRVLAPDLPGFGATAKPRGPYTAGWFARWLNRFLLQNGAEPAVLVGNSLGGRVALELGLAAPDSVRGLVLLCPSPAFRRLRQLSPLVRLLRPELAALPLRVSRPIVVESIRSMFSVPDRLPAPWYDAAADEFLRVFADRRARTAFFAVLRGIYTEQAYGSRGFWDRLPALRPPALFVWGDRDRLVPASYARHVAAALPAAGSVVLEDSGHVPQFEHPAELMLMIRGFLDSVDAPGAIEPGDLPHEVPEG